MGVFVAASRSTRSAPSRSAVDRHPIASASATTSRARTTTSTPKRVGVTPALPRTNRSAPSSRSMRTNWLLTAGCEHPRTVAVLPRLSVSAIVQRIRRCRSSSSISTRP